MEQNMNVYLDQCNGVQQKLIKHICKNQPGYLYQISKLFQRKLTSRDLTIYLTDLKHHIPAITKTEAIQRYSKTFIEQIMVYEEKPNPHYSRGAPMRLYSQTLLEKMWVAGKWVKPEKKESRVLGAKKAVETKKIKTMHLVEKMKVNIPLMSIEKLRKNAIRSYNDFQFEKGYDGTAAMDSDILFLDRITVNYIRHNLTRYESTLNKLYSKVGKNDAYHATRTKIFNEISKLYPELSDECNRQQKS